MLPGRNTGGDPAVENIGTPANAAGGGMQPMVPHDIPGCSWVVASVGGIVLEPPQELLPVQGCWVAVVATPLPIRGIAGFGVVPGTTAGSCTAAGGTVAAAWGQVLVHGTVAAVGFPGLVHGVAGGPWVAQGTIAPGRGTGVDQGRPLVILVALAS